MPIRTITAPGVEIKEIDKSQVAPAMTNTKCLLMGFASKGEDYIPHQFTSTEAWINTFGEPTNEAERYFYNGCAEVIKHSGVLYCSKLPYENASRDKYVAFKYKVGKTLNAIPSTADLIITGDPSLRQKLLTKPAFNQKVWDYIANTYISTDVNVKTAIKQYKFGEKIEGESDTFYQAQALAIEIYDSLASIVDSSTLASIPSPRETFTADELLESCIDMAKAIDDLKAINSNVEDSSLSESIGEISRKGYDLSQLIESMIDTAQLHIALTRKLSSVMFETTVSAYIHDHEVWSELSSQSVEEYLGFTVDDEARLIDEAISTLSRADIVAIDPTFDDKLAEIEKTNLSVISNNIGDLAYSVIRDIDKTVSSYLEIEAADLAPTMIDISSVDEYRTLERSVGSNTFLIVDTTRAQYDKIPEDERKQNKTELVGIIPVVTTAANAMFAQSLIQATENIVSAYEPILSVATLDAKSVDEKLESQFILSTDVSQQLNSQNPISAQGQTHLNMDTVSKTAIDFFPTVGINAEGRVDTDLLKNIGVVVFKSYIDPGNGNKISFEIVEAFSGSLDKEAKDPNTGTSRFIDKIINTQSNYINFFSNCFTATSTKLKYDDASLLVMKPSITPSFGFYEKMCESDISLSESIFKAIDRVTEKVSDINERDIDLVVDAGVSNIAQYITAVFNGTKGKYDPVSPDASAWKLKTKSDAKTWMSVCQKYNNICANVRKDCMFIADGLRPLCIVGDKPIIRDSKPSNTIDANILPFIKTITGLNTNYGAGYCDWFEMTDDFTGDLFWCPPSIHACGIYIDTDSNANYWDAPAGLNRGQCRSAVGVAFSPTPKQAGVIYEKNWNYAINYPDDGIILEGQKTFQVKPSAFDRVNVRRLFLRLERQAYKVSRYFVYEPNNAFTRQRLVDALEPDIKDAYVRGGLYGYKIICDETNNTPDVIDKNELHVTIGLQPTRTAEYIMITFVALRTGASWSELENI